MDESGARRLDPRASFGGTARRVSINRWGFRGPDITLQKPEGVRRIVALGESTTFGLEARDDDSVWTAQLESLLNQHDRSVEWQVINAGIPGNTVGGCRRFLEQELLSFQPDIVLLLCAATDISAHARLQYSYESSSVDEQNDRTGYDPGILIRKHSLLWNLIRLNTAPLRDAISPSRQNRRLDDRGLARFDGELEELIRLCRRANTSAMLCTYPRSFGDPTAPSPQWALAQSALAANPLLGMGALNDAFDRYNEAIRAVADSLTVPLVDLDRVVPRRATYFHDSIHFNDAGHALVAASLFEAVRDWKSGTLASNR